MGADLLLSGSDHKLTQRIRCPIHGFIKYSVAERKVIDSPEFLRLRHIRQLALEQYVYPGATHTRFEHSLGVMELASKAFEVVCSKKPDELNGSLRAVGELSEDTLRRARQVLRLFALFHDVGHPPFSHAGEVGDRHEEYSKGAVENFAGELDKSFFPGCASVVRELFEKELKTDRAPLKLLQDIISGEMDMDRADYLLRDSYHCGVEYGRFDHQRMIESLNVTQSDYGLELCIDKSGFHTVEALLLARYQMLLQVYFHRVRRICDYYLGRFVKSWVEEAKEITVDQFYHSDDVDVLAAMKKHAGTADSPAKAWAERVLARDLHRCVYESSEHADVKEVPRVERLCNAAQAEFADDDFVFDKAPGTVHRLYVPEDRDLIDDLQVLDERTGGKKSIGLVSKVIAKIPKTFCVCRIFWYPNRESPNPTSEKGKSRLKEIADWCSQKEPKR